MKEIPTEDAPSSIGPYSQGIEADGRVYVSGQGPIDPDSGDVVSEGIEEQTERTFENIGAILEAADSGLGRVIKANVYLTDIENYDAINRVYSRYVTDPYPARAAVEVSDLPADIDVEIEVVALSE